MPSRWLGLSLNRKIPLYDLLCVHRKGLGSSTVRQSVCHVALGFWQGNRFGITIRTIWRGACQGWLVGYMVAAECTTAHCVLLWTELRSSEQFSQTSVKLARHLKRNLINLCHSFVLICAIKLLFVLVWLGCLLPRVVSQCIKPHSSQSQTKNLTKLVLFLRAVQTWLVHDWFLTHYEFNLVLRRNVSGTVGR